MCNIMVSPLIIKDFTVNIIDHFVDGGEMVSSGPEKHALAHHFPIVLAGRHLAQNVFLARLDTGWDGNGAADNGLHTLPGEGDGLFGSGRNARLVEHKDLRGRVVFLDILCDVGVVRATSTHEDLVNV